VSRHRATLAWLPNFAFAFLAQRAKAEPGQYDLSSLRSVINCSEPVSQEAMHAFANRFAGDGLSPTALATCYAMAENVFAVTTSSADCLPRYRESTAVWHNQHRLKSPTQATSTPWFTSATAAASPIAKYASWGTTPRCRLAKWADPVRSSFLFCLLRRDDLNTALFDTDGFSIPATHLDEDGHLYVTGRAKDLVIIGGRMSIRRTSSKCQGERRACRPRGLFRRADAEMAPKAWWCWSRRQPEVPGKGRRAVRISVPARLDIDLADARVVPRGKLRKSTSGKLARGGNREWYLNGTFGTIPPTISSAE
jgi:hypothetical protein